MISSKCDAIRICDNDYPIKYCLSYLWTLWRNINRPFPHLTSVRVRTDCYMLTGSDSCCCFELLCSPLTLSSFLLVSCVFCPPLALILKIWAGKDHLVQCDSCKTLVLFVRYSSFQGVQFSFFSLMKDKHLCYSDIRDIVSSIIAF